MNDFDNMHLYSSSPEDNVEDNSSSSTIPSDDDFDNMSYTSEDNDEDNTPSSPIPTDDDSIGPDMVKSDVVEGHPGANWSLDQLVLAASCPATSRMALRQHLLPRVQPHQWDAVKMCIQEINGIFLMKSGVLTLPCGSGKTLIGVILLTMARVRTLIVAKSVEQIGQWRNTLLQWTDLGR